MTAPNNYKDPYWSQLAASTESKLGLPAGILSSIVMRGERSNQDQVSNAGARTVFQITPGTRKAAIDKYGVDPYLSPENAAEVAGLLLKDSLDRNGGSIPDAVGEYHGGVDRANWGPKTRAYVARVVTAKRSAPKSQGTSTFDRVMAANPQFQQLAPTQGSDQISRVYQAYKSGKMPPDEASQFEQDVSSGLVMLPRGATLNGQASQSPTEMPAPVVLPQAITEAYRAGKMSDQERADLEADVKAGLVKLPVASVDTVPGGPDWKQPTEQGIIPTERVPTLGERLIGTGEAGLSLLTGATGGALGMIGGTVEGITKSIIDGTYGTQAAADQTEALAAQRAQSMTYAPRTQQGQSQTETAASALESAMPVVPMTGEMAALGAGARAAAPAIASVAQRGAGMASQALESVKPAVSQAVEAVRSAPRKMASAVGLAESEVPIAATGRGASIGAAATPAELERTTTAESLPVPISLTRGAASRDAAQLAFEKEQIKNPELGAPLRQRAEENNLQALQNFDAAIDLTGAEAPDIASTGNAVTKALSDGYKAAKNKTNAAYTKARKSPEAQAAVDLNRKVIISGIAETSDPADYYYHGTPIKNVKSIEENGLTSGLSGMTGVTLNGPEAALNWSRTMQKGNEPALVRIPKSKVSLDMIDGNEGYIRDGVPKDAIEISVDGGKTWHAPSGQPSDAGVSLIGYLNSKVQGVPSASVTDTARKLLIKMGLAAEDDMGNLKPLPGVTVGKMEDFRRELSGTAKWDDRVGIREETILKKLVDAQTEPQAGPLYQEARAARTAQARKFENRAIVSRLVQNIKGMDDPKVAADQVFQKSILNSSPEEITFLRRVLSTSGSDGQQAWKELQGALVRHLRDESTKGMGMDSESRPLVSPAKLHGAVTALDKNGRLDAVLGKSTADIIRDLNDVVRYVNTAPPGTLINSSGTAGALMAAIGEAGLTGSLTGVPVPVMSVLRAISKQVKNAKTKAKIQEALNRRSH